MASYLEACKTFRDIPIFYSRDNGQEQNDDHDSGAGDVRQPFVPLKDYVAGNFGVVRPQYGYIYLWISYRYLTGKPLSKANIEFLVDITKDKKKTRIDWNKEWANEANRLLDQQGAMPGQYISVMQQTSQNSLEFMSFENCTDDAFRYALKRLEALRKKHPDKSPIVMRWIKAQQRVFENSLMTSNAPILPEPPPIDACADEKYEYAYQIASSYFYAMDYYKSAHLFEQIAQDSTSPYKDIAVYLVMRSYYRNLIYKQEKPNVTSLPQMKVKEKSKPWYKIWYENFLNYFPFTNRENVSVKKINSGIDYERKLFFETYAKLFPKITHNPYKEDIEGLYHAIKIQTEPNIIVNTVGNKLVDASCTLSNRLLKDFDYIVRSHSELTGTKKLDNEFFEWRRLFRAKDSYKEAYTYWQQNKSLLWLIVVLEKIPMDAPELNEVLDAAEKVRKESPAFVTLAYQRAKLFIAKSDIEKGNALIDKVLANPILLSTKNRFLDLKVAKNYSDFLKNILQTPVGPQDGSLLPVYYVEYELTKKSEVDFDWEHFGAMQKTSVAMLLKAAEQKEFPDWLKENLLMAAFSRSVILGADKEAITVAQLLQVMQPKLKEPLDLYVNEMDPKRRSFIESLIILRYPKMSIFVNPHSWRASRKGGYLDLNEYDTQSGFRDQWWKDNVLKRCAEKPDVNFLSAEDQKAVSYELNELAEKLNDKTDYFCKLTLAWFNENQKDPLLPEMMHRCIQMSRYNKHYDAKSNLESSYDVFRLLHKHFKNSEYAKKTPFHYYSKKK